MLYTYIPRDQDVNPWQNFYRDFKRNNLNVTASNHEDILIADILKKDDILYHITDSKIQLTFWSEEDYLFFTLKWGGCGYQTD